MKKIIALLCLLTAAVLVLASCAGASPYEKESWVYSNVVEVSLKEDVDELRLEQLTEEFGTSDPAAIEAAMLAKILEENTFAKCYVKFSGGLAAFYDIVMEREATYAVYKTAENEGFFSVYTELNVADGNPDPNTNPPFSYDPETNTFVVELSHVGFSVSIEYRAE